MSDFNDYLNKIKSGEEFLLESAIPPKLINTFVRQCVYSLEQMKPHFESVAAALGIEYNENLAEDEDFLKTYNQVVVAFETAKIEFLKSLNKNLKSIS